MHIVINGQQQNITSRTLAELVAARKLDSRSLVVELNGNIIKEARWASVPLKEGDRLELLSFVGGG